MTKHTATERQLAELCDKLMEDNTRFRMGMARVFELAPNALLDTEIDTIVNNALNMAIDLRAAKGLIEKYHKRVGDLESATTMKIAYQRALKALSERG